MSTASAACRTAPGAASGCPCAVPACGHHPITCILPPHVLTAIALNSPNKALRGRALATIQATHTLSTARVGYAALGSIGTRGVPRRSFGAVGRRLAASIQHKTRTIYSADNHQRIPGHVERREGQGATGDDAVDEAYTYMGDTSDFYWQAFARDSIDNAGMPLEGTVHYSQDYDNAYWDGQRMVYGDGDGIQFERFTKSVDVIGHELTHGVTQYEAGLIYLGQPGALNESISDVFGSMVRQFSKNQTAAQADWLIGAELFVPGAVNGVAIRSMKAPGTAYDDPVLGKDPQPAVMDQYVHTGDDNGGVHINSGIPNHAFYLLAVDLGGRSWDKAGQIWYRALRSPALTRRASFTAFARLTVTAARQLFPVIDAPEPPAVQRAWAQVGIHV
jgi:Zn-dependent metalloprotease